MPILNLIEFPNAIEFTRLKTLYLPEMTTTAKLHELPLITSDRFILQNSDRLGMVAIDLRTI
jgi:hypothetical protein